MHIKMHKKEIRKAMKQKRAALSKEAVLDNSNAIWHKIYDMPAFQSSSTVLLYSSIGNEVNTAEIAKVALANNKQIAYPSTNMNTNTMEFHTVNDISELIPVKSGSFNLLEPLPDLDTKVIPNENTLMIVPGLAFDKQFYRIGYGGGFYDKYIEKHPDLITIGVCYDFQVVSNVHPQSYDQAVQRIVTPSGVRD